MSSTVHRPHAVQLGELLPAQTTTVLRLRAIGKVSDEGRHAALTVRLPRVKLQLTAYSPELIEVAVRSTRIMSRWWKRGWDKAQSLAELEGVLFCLHLTQKLQHVRVGHHQGLRMGSNDWVREMGHETERGGTGRRISASFYRPLTGLTYLCQIPHTSLRSERPQSGRVKGLGRGLRDD